MQGIDIVVPWVDGSDSDWIVEKSAFESDPNSQADGRDSGINRYRDWGLLRFWFRSVEKYIPWVRTVHFVTWGHLPSFLNLDYEKLHVVRHEDYIPARYLPTFSSHTIELNIHRIPGLSDKFIYFNDDTFVLRPMGSEEFFDNNLPCTCGSEYPLVFYGEIRPWLHALANDLGVINKHFPKQEAVRKNKKKYLHPRYRMRDNIRTIMLEKAMFFTFTGFRFYHSPNAYLKTTFEEVWGAEERLLDQTCMHRFRACEDVNQLVMLWWQIASGQFTPRRVDSVALEVTDHNIGKICDIIKHQKNEMLCIHDPDQRIDFCGIQKKMIDSFEKILPEKSSFEL